MPGTIGRITIPTFTPSEVFPITRLDYGFGVSQQPHIAVHRFESANRKITQRFLMGNRVLMGNRARKFTISRASLTKAESDALLAFWESMNSIEKPFWFDAPMPIRFGATEG